MELHRSAEEKRFDARLRLGEHAALMSDLQTALADEPLREGRWAQLMLALYRSGSQAEALRTYERLRSTPDEVLGIEPSDQLRALEGAILDQDAALNQIRTDRPWVPRSPSRDGD
jgi:DNA-binding SARP family transcriptional activator